MAAQRILLREGVWATIGQIGSAIGTLVGIRALTEFVEPEVYGGVTLLVGVIALALGTVVTPVMQAALRYYPEYADGRVQILRQSIISLISRRVVFCLLVLSILGPGVVHFSGLDGTLLLLSGLLLILNGLKTLETVLLNSARRQKSYAMISLAEAWGRPFVAILAVSLLGTEAKTVLIAYAFTSATILLLFYSFAKPEGAVDNYTACPSEPELKAAIKRYSLPLVPMAGLGWINGVGDRYLIGGLLGLSQAGIYSAVYGLLSRPFLMVSSIVELTLRPHYYQMVADQKHQDADRLLVKWLAIVAGLVSTGFIGIVLFDDLIAKLLLAEKYRSGVTIMVWIAGGYALLALSDVFTKICYAYEYTGRILIIQIVGAVLSLAFSTIGILQLGLTGAAMAVPAYFGAMLVITIVASRVNIHKPSARYSGCPGEAN